ncbi:MAG TPA: DUF2207 domain-containing protein [Candidatus Acidoferrum sp.]|nr:DUF2207 domain-containing protein [Candidatus Acidoferrum sp.]
MLSPRSRFLLRIALFFVAFAVPAAARQLVIKNFDEQVRVHRDSSIDVTENIQTQFIGGPWHGIYRTIPIQYQGPGGFNYTLFIENVSAREPDGKHLRVEQSHHGPNLEFKIYVPNADNSTQTIVLHYRVLNALRFFTDHDELYWNVTGQEWDAPIESASAGIELPEGAAGVHAVAYTGVLNSRTQQAEVRVNANLVQVYSSTPLGYRQGLTVVVGFDKGLVHQPTLSERIGQFLRSNWPLLVFPIGAFLIMFWVWWTRGRDPQHDAITVQYDPPGKLTPAECGTLIDDDVAMRDITATLVDLAVRGYLVIEEKNQSGMLGLTHHRDYVFHLKKPADQWQDTRPHERAMLSALFYDGDIPANSTTPASGPAGASAALDSGQPETSVALSQLQNHFYQQLPPIRDCVFDALVMDGYYLHRPDTVRQGYIGGGFLIGLLIIFGGNWWATQSGMSGLTWIVAGILCGAVICGFGWFMPARTITGAQTYAKVLGFEQFLGRVEKDRIKRLENAPATFEKYLPYAMALRVDKKWVKAFDGIAMQPPQWYQGAAYTGAFQPFFLVAALDSMSAQAGTVMASSPRSSGVSGFGGGGGAGGGFGGGGGGGF